MAVRDGFQGKTAGGRRAARPRDERPAGGLRDADARQFGQRATERRAGGAGHDTTLGMPIAATSPKMASTTDQFQQAETRLTRAARLAATHHSSSHMPLSCSTALQTFSPSTMVGTPPYVII